MASLGCSNLTSFWMWAPATGRQALNEFYRVLSINILPGMPTKWEDFVGFQGNPNVPSIAGVMSAIFSEDERATFEKHLRPLVEKGHGQLRHAGLFLWAWKPGGWSWNHNKSG